MNVALLVPGGLFCWLVVETVRYIRFLEREVTRLRADAAGTHQDPT
jgi:hypothetical protein